MSMSTAEAKQSLAMSPEGVGVPSKTEANPMNPSLRKLLPLLQAPRCGARNRAGKPCQSPKVRDKARCRLHGGAKGSGAPQGRSNGSYRHGLFTCEAIETRRQIRGLIAQSQGLTGAIL